MIKLQELTIPGCVECARFERFWESTKKDWPDVIYEKIDGTTPQGEVLIQRYQIMASPGIIINGKLFSVGGVNQKAFLEKLQSSRKKP